MSRACQAITGFLQKQVTDYMAVPVLKVYYNEYVRKSHTAANWIGDSGVSALGSVSVKAPVKSIIFLSPGKRNYKDPHAKQNLRCLWIFISS